MIEIIIVIILLLLLCIYFYNNDKYIVLNYNCDDYKCHKFNLV
jgi:hypothetical protein